MLSFHCLRERLKVGEAGALVFAQREPQGRQLSLQEGQSRSSSDWLCDPEQVLSLTSSAHSQPGFSGSLQPHPSVTEGAAATECVRATSTPQRGVC